MTSLEQISSVISQLESTHGETIPIADLRQAISKLFVSQPPAVAVKPVAPSVAPPAAGTQCNGITTKKTQCSKKGTEIGPDGKAYCKQHLGKSGSPAATATTAASSAAAPSANVSSSSSSVSVPLASASSLIVPKKPSCSISVGNAGAGSDTTCNHHIAGKNPRRCDKTGKETGTDGLLYCGTHIKSHRKDVGAAAATASNAKAAELMQTSEETANIVFNEAVGLGVDGNNICFVGNYKTCEGVHACARHAAGQLVDLTPEDIELCTKREYPMLPKEFRDEIIAMTAEQRSQIQ